MTETAAPYGHLHLCTGCAHVRDGCCDCRTSPYYRYLVRLLVVQVCREKEASSKWQGPALAYPSSGANLKA